MERVKKTKMGIFHTRIHKIRFAELDSFWPVLQLRRSRVDDMMTGKDLEGNSHAIMRNLFWHVFKGIEWKTRNVSVARISVSARICEGFLAEHSTSTT
jgi:hypothetical protein